MQSQDNQKVIAAILCLFLFFVYWQSVATPYLNPVPQQPSQQGTISGDAAVGTESQLSPAPRMDEATSAPEQTPRGTLATDSKVTTSPSDDSYPTDAQLKSSGTVRVQTEVLDLTFSRLGGRVISFLLQQYNETVEPDSPKLSLLHHVEKTPYPLGVSSGPVDDTRVVYDVQVIGSEASGAENKQQVNAKKKTEIVFSGTLPDGRTIEKKLSFQPDNYLIDVNVRLGSAPADRSRLELEYSELVVGEVESFQDARGYVKFDGEKAKREIYTSISEFEDQGVGEILLGNSSWVALGDNYFASALISPEEPTPARLFKNAELYRIRLAGSDTAGAFKIYTGPKSYSLLQDHGFELKRLIDFGWFGFISAPLLSLLHWFYGVFGNYGLAVVVLTILVKWLLFPLNSASYKQMKAMQDLQPEMKRIREQMSDKQAQQMALMELYKKRGVNPFGGCFPMLLQLPIFLGLYYGLMVAIELRHAPFAFWITDLSAPEKLMIGGIGIPVMVILMVVSMLVQQWTSPSAMDPVQKKTMMVIPVVFGFMFALFPAGLTLYWLTSNLISIGQQKGLQSEGKVSPVKVTLIVSVSVFLLCWLIVLAG